MIQEPLKLIGNLEEAYINDKVNQNFKSTQENLFKLSNYCMVIISEKKKKIAILMV